MNSALIIGSNLNGFHLSRIAEIFNLSQSLIEVTLSEAAILEVVTDQPALERCKKGCRALSEKGLLQSAKEERFVADLQNLELAKISVKQAAWALSLIQKRPLHARMGGRSLETCMKALRNCLPDIDEQDMDDGDLVRAYWADPKPACTLPEWCEWARIGRAVGYRISVPSYNDYSLSDPDAERLESERQQIISQQAKPKRGKRKPKPVEYPNAIRGCGNDMSPVMQALSKLEAALQKPRPDYGVRRGA